MSHYSTKGFYAGAPWGGVIVIAEEDLAITSREILHNPVDYALASDQDEKQRKMRTRGAMTKSMMNKIFRE